MTRFYFHIRDGGTLIPDEVGMDLAGLDEARAEARLSVGDLAHAARAGKQDASTASIEIADRHGMLVEAMPARGYLH